MYSETKRIIENIDFIIEAFNRSNSPDMATWKYKDSNLRCKTFRSNIKLGNSLLQNYLNHLNIFESEYWRNYKLERDLIPKRLLENELLLKKNN